MNSQPENQPQSNSQPRIIVPVKDEHKTRLKYPTPSWWPSTNAKRLALGHRVADANHQIGAWSNPHPLTIPAANE